MSIATEIQRLQTAKANIKTAIEEKGVEVGDGTIDTYAEKISEISSGGSGDYDQGYEDGKNSVVDLGRFCGSITFHDLNLFGTEKVTLYLDNATNFTAFIGGNTPNTTVKHLTLNCAKPFEVFLRVFGGSTSTVLERITLNIDLSQATQISWIAWSYPNLKIIDGTPLNLSALSANQYLFFNCSQLQEVRIVKETLKVSTNFSSNKSLSAETIQSIIDGLADLTGGTAQTLTLHATVGAKLTDEQKATITAKNWTLVY